MRTAHPHTDGRVDRGGIGLHYEIYGDGLETIRFTPTWMFIPSRGYTRARLPVSGVISAASHDTRAAMAGQTAQMIRKCSVKVTMSPMRWRRWMRPARKRRSCSVTHRAGPSVPFSPL